MNITRSKLGASSSWSAAMRKLVVAVGSVALFAGCMTTDPYTGEQELSKTGIGTTIGAVTGAVLGNQVKGKRKTRDQAMVAGALIGGAIGNRIGNYMDVQENKLRRKLRNTGVSVTRHGNKIILNMPSNITFDTGRSQIKDHFVPVLESVGHVVKEYTRTRVEVRGHTDSRGTTSSNQILSEQRAQSVASFLREEGVQGNRLVAIGYGESNPVSSNSTASGRRLNRRVEVTLAPIGH